MEWEYKWPSGMLREQNLLQLSKSELFALEKSFSVYLSEVEAKHNKKPAKPKKSLSPRPRKNAKASEPDNRDRICIDAAHDYKVIGDRLKKVLAMGKNGKQALPRYF